VPTDVADSAPGVALMRRNTIGRVGRWVETERARRRRRDFYGHLIAPGDLVFDVGANVGNRVESFVALGATVVAVEPLTECADVLERRFGRTSTTVVRQGLAAQIGTATLRTTTASTIASMSGDFIDETRASGRFAEFDWTEARQVDVTTLDALIGQYGVPDFIKIDVEGFEPEILRGLSCPVPALSFEFALELVSHAEECMQRLQELGDYEFAYSAGESMAWTVDWTTMQNLLLTLRSTSDPLEWGDIYARRTDVQSHNGAASPSVSALGETVPRGRVDVLGVGVSPVSLRSAVSTIMQWLHDGGRHYVCVSNVHTVMACQRDEELRRIHNASGLTTPDGMPLVWCARRAGADDVTRVYGPDLMLALSATLASEGRSVFLYGTTPTTLALLAARLTEKFPGLKIAGSYAPPFRALDVDEDADVCRQIDDSGADVVWVGLGAVKQERWMAEHTRVLHAPVLIGVGAAFDFHAGVVAQAPLWMQRRGLEWIYRLVREPRRLWRRYLSTIPWFMVKIVLHPPRIYPPTVR
jgi:N-acetylglucosaminyldiphosphoundecaprenol N-acetyl-beta-D-mannosaminyltransferase